MDETRAKSLKDCLSKGLVSPRVLLDKLRMIDEDSRRSSQYQDPQYLPFYYHLAKVSKPRSVVNSGFDLGLPLCCFLQGCSSVEEVFCLQRPTESFYSPRMGLSNIKSVKGRSVRCGFHMGNVSDPEVPAEFDLAIITDRAGSDLVHESMEVIWSKLNFDGLMCVDYLVSNPKLGQVFSSFCKARSKEGFVFPTRYGTGIVQK